MAKVKISELPELNIATLDTTYVAGIYNDATYKIAVSRLTSSLDTTFATDLVVNAISGTISTLTTTASLNALSTSVDSRLTILESFSSSADNRYILSGSLTQTTWENISGKPNNIVSSSTQISDLGFVTGSYTTLNSFNNLTQSFNSISQSYTTDSSSFDNRITTEKNRIDAILSASNANSDTFAEVVSLINSVDLTNDNAFATFYTASNSRITSLENATSSYLTSLNGAISSSQQVLNGSGIFSSSAQLPSGLISSSLEFVTTSSYQTDSSSFNSRIISGSAVAGTISSSAQISGLGYATTSSLNSFTSSYNTDSSSFNSRFNGLVTTGSNTFSGSQVFSGSMTVTSGQIVASLITANTSSLYLTSGSNMYVQNNGVVEITGSLKVKGTSRFETVGGDEGGEIEFGVPQTNTTLSTSVKADVYQNRFRIFDGNTNGVYIDLSKAPTGANGELMHKASGFVNAGDYITLGNLKARIPTSGNRSVQVATVSGTYSVYGSNIYSQAGGIAGLTLSSPLSITTTPAYLSAANNFTVAGATDTWVISDTVNFIAWRITIVIGPLYNANLITIERLY